MEKENIIFADLLKLILEKQRHSYENTNISWVEEQAIVKKQFEQKVPHLLTRIHHACELLDNFYGSPHR
jgi:hypothetical protein